MRGEDLCVALQQLNCVFSTWSNGRLVLLHCSGADMTALHCSNDQTNIVRILWLPHSQWSVFSLFPSVMEVRLLVPMCVSVCLCFPCVCSCVPGVPACACVCVSDCVCFVCFCARVCLCACVACVCVCVCFVCFCACACACLYMPCMPPLLAASELTDNVISGYFLL